MKNSTAKNMTKITNGPLTIFEVIKSEYSTEQNIIAKGTNQEDLLIKNEKEEKGIDFLFPIEMLFQ